MADLVQSVDTVFINPVISSTPARVDALVYKKKSLNYLVRLVLENLHLFLYLICEPHLRPVHYIFNSKTHNC